MGDEERFYCSGCCPAEPEYMFNIFDPLLSGFINKKGFKILHQNVNGIYKKLDQIKTFLSDSKNSIHVVGFSETHTNSTVSDAELNIQGYSFERLDRTNGSHGGVSLYIRDDIQYQRRKDLEIEGFNFYGPKSSSQNRNRYWFVQRTDPLILQIILTETLT